MPRSELFPDHLAYYQLRSKPLDAAESVRLVSFRASHFSGSPSPFSKKR